MTELSSAPSLAQTALELPAVIDAGADAGAAVDTAHAGSVRRFGALARLFGDAAALALARAHVVVVGLGGVGSWTAEALARSGVGELTLVDLDHVSESNVNRQIHALQSTIGAPKGDVMAARIRDISPGCRVRFVDDFVSPDNVARLLTDDAAIVVDAIDRASAKAALIAHCVAREQALVVCGAAGGRTDPLRLSRGDLSRTRGDALLASVRSRLRRHHGFARDARAFGVQAIWSDEPPRALAAACDLDRAGMPLACAGYGSFVAVTAAMGMAAAHAAVAMAIERSSRKASRSAARRLSASR